MKIFDKIKNFLSIDWFKTLYINYKYNLFILGGVICRCMCIEIQN